MNSVLATSNKRAFESNEYATSKAKSANRDQPQTLASTLSQGPHIQFGSHFSKSWKLRPPVTIPTSAVRTRLNSENNSSAEENNLGYKTSLHRLHPGPKLYLDSERTVERTYYGFCYRRGAGAHLPSAASDSHVQNLKKVAEHQDSGLIS